MLELIKCVFITPNYGSGTYGSNYVYFKYDIKPSDFQGLWYKLTINYHLSQFSYICLGYLCNVIGLMQQKEFLINGNLQTELTE